MVQVSEIGKVGTVTGEVPEEEIVKEPGWQPLLPDPLEYPESQFAHELEPVADAKVPGVHERHCVDIVWAVTDLAGSLKY